MLPGLNGYDVLRKMRNSQEIKNIPLIILSEKKDELDIVLALELGADDYITKPFSMKILLSKMKVLLKRKHNTQVKVSKNLTFLDYTLEVDKYLLRKGKEEICLTLSEFGILKRLITNKGKVLSRHQLLDDVNNEDPLIVDRNIDVHVASLRKKLKNFRIIETVRGIGYRFKVWLY